MITIFWEILEPVGRVPTKRQRGRALRCNLLQRTGKRIYAAIPHAVFRHCEEVRRSNLIRCKYFFKKIEISFIEVNLVLMLKCVRDANGNPFWARKLCVEVNREFNDYDRNNETRKDCSDSPTLAVSFARGTLKKTFFFCSVLVSLRPYEQNKEEHICGERGDRGYFL